MLPIPNLQTIIMFGGQSGLQRKNFSLSMKTSAEVTTNFISGICVMVMLIVITAIVIIFSRVCCTVLKSKLGFMIYAVCRTEQ